MIENLLTQIGTTAAVVAIASYLLRSWLSYQIQSLRISYEHHNSIQIEAIRAEFSKEATRLGIHENYLHTRRVELIEKIYHLAVDAEFALQSFFVGWWAAKKTKDIKQPHLDIPRDRETSIRMMEKHGMIFCEKFVEINASLHKNALFFDDDFIQRVRGAYDPFFQMILNLDYNALPNPPERYRDVVSAGKVPRQLIVNLFRASLGVSSSDG